MFITFAALLLLGSVSTIAQASMCHLGSATIGVSNRTAVTWHCVQGSAPPERTLAVAAGLKLIATTDTRGALRVTGAERNGRSGTWSIDRAQLAGYRDLVLGLHTANGYGLFRIGDLAAGNWAISRGHLIRGDLYGQITPVPLPAAAWLFGSGLLGMGLLSRRNRASATKAKTSEASAPQIAQSEGR